MKKRYKIQETRDKKIDIEHVAKLANLKLTETEKKKFAGQLSQILDYFEKLSEVDTKKVQPLAYAAGLTNVARVDETIPSLESSQALKNAKSTYQDFFKVKAIFDAES